jgi:ergothioneine biosynthesis protein EgtB
MASANAADLGSAPAIQTSYRTVRGVTESLAAPLSAEDCQVQSMPEASPTKWHLAHTTWFFETFLLQPYLPGHRTFHPRFEVLFNSYYEQVGPQHPRAERGLLSRPTLAEIHDYRRYTDTAVEVLCAKGNDLDPDVARILELGLQHEQQHQELILMDIKHALGTNPLRPAYRRSSHRRAEAAPVDWRGFPGGMYEIGHQDPGFGFDNESPRHPVWVQPFELASRLVTNAEWLAFIDDHGYERPELWLADGWTACKRQRWRAPLYWQREHDHWLEYRLDGLAGVDGDAPVCHVS